MLKETPVETPLNFNRPILDFRGEPIEKIKIKELLLQVIGSYKSRDGEESIKAYSLGVQIHKDQVLVADEIVLLRKIVEGAEQLPTISKGQILLMLKNR